MRGYFALLLLAVPTSILSGCYEKESDRSGLPCEPGFSSICYTGPENTIDVGVCHRGQSYCWEEEGEIHQACLNEVVPGRETCNGLDDDCDGIEDNNGACVSESLSRIESESGPTKALWRPDTIGPFLLVNAHLGSLHRCPQDTTNYSCVDEFMSTYGDAFGIHDLDAQLGEPNVFSSGNGVSVTYLQEHEGVRVEGGSITIGAVGNRVYNVLSTILEVRHDLETRPVVTESVIESSLGVSCRASGDDDVEPCLLTVFTEPEEDGSLPPVGEQSQVLAYRVEATSAVTFVDADNGEVLSTESLSDSDLRVRINGSLVNDPSTLHGDGALAYQQMFNLYGFIIEQDVFHLHDGYDSPGGHFFIDLDTDACNVEPFTCESGLASGCTDDDGIHICPGSVTLESTIHEASHYLFRQHFNGIGPAGDSIDEGLAMAHWCLFSWYRRVTEDDESYSFECPTSVYSRVSGEVLERELSGGLRRTTAAFDGNEVDDTDERTGADIDDIETWDEMVHNNGFVVAYAFYRIMALFSMRMETEEALSKTQYLLYHTVLEALPLWEGYIARVEDIFAATYWTAQSLWRRGDDAGGAYFTGEDLADIWGAFRDVFFVNCDFPEEDFRERCDGRDDNCDGTDDNCTDYETCCRALDAVGVDCDWRVARWEHYSLTRSCYPVEDGLVHTEGVGECHAGYQLCLPDSGWMEDCVDARVPDEEEVCDPEWLDGDCDGMDDHEAGLTVRFAPDADGDGYPSRDGPFVYQCPDHGPEGYLAINEASAPTYLDCDDSNADVYWRGPDHSEGDDPDSFCSGYDDVPIDHDCDLVVDEGCRCREPSGVTPPNRLCGTDVGACARGIQTCEHIGGGRWDWSDCRGAVEESLEICDGIDNDCDSRIDERPLEGIGDRGECYAPGSNGLCAENGHYECTDGHLECRGVNLADATWSTEEGCSWDDRDCDGVPGVIEVINRLDRDGDGYPSREYPTECTRIHPVPIDCDDSDATLIGPTGTVDCDENDHNCNGVADYLDILSDYDRDGDGVHRSGYPPDCRTYASDDTDCDDSNATIDGPCPPCSAGHGRHSWGRYFWCEQGIGYSVAQLNCASVGTSLVAFNSPDERNTVRAAVAVQPRAGNFWVAVSQPASVRDPDPPSSGWTYGGVRDVYEWCVGEPNDEDGTENGQENHAVVDIALAGCLRDVDGLRHFGFVCEWPP